MKNICRKVKRNLFTAGILLLSFIHCTEDNSLSPEELIEFQAIFLDVTIAHSAADNFPLSMRDSMKKVYQTQVFDLHSITAEEYRNYQKRIENNPEQAVEIYATVMDSLNKMKKIQDALDRE